MNTSRNLYATITSTVGIERGGGWGEREKGWGIRERRKGTFIPATSPARFLGGNAPLSPGTLSLYQS